MFASSPSLPRWAPAGLLALALLCAAPLSASVAVVGGLTREAVVQPGATIEGRLVLRNAGETASQARIYQSDYLFWADGRNEYGEPGSTPRSNATWLQVTPSQVTIEPGATESVYYTLRVPEQADLVGTYWSLIMVEPIAEAALEPPTPEEGKAKVGFQTVLRYAVQVVTHLGTSGTQELKFTERALSRTEDGKLVLSIDAENMGERWLMPTLWAELYDDRAPWSAVSRVGASGSSKAARSAIAST